jgi:hypothetical protein
MLERLSRRDEGARHGGDGPPIGATEVNRSRSRALYAVATFMDEAMVM